MLHGAHVKEMAKTFTVVFMKARKSLVVRWREKSVNWKKYDSMVEMYVLKLILKFIMKISVSVTRINGGKIVPHCVRFLHIYFWSGRKRVYLYGKSHVMWNNQSKKVHFLFNKGTYFLCKYLILNTSSQKKYQRMSHVLNFLLILPKIAASLLDLPPKIIITSLSTSVTVTFILSTKYSLFTGLLKMEFFLGILTLTGLSLEQFFNDSNSPH